MTRSLSGWVYANLYWYGITAPVDFVSGAAYRQGPDTVRATFSLSPVAAAIDARQWKVSRGDLMRFTRSDQALWMRGRFVGVDSVAMTIDAQGRAMRVSRADIGTLQRADGRRYDLGLRNGVIGGAVAGAVAVAASKQGTAGYVDFGAAPAIGAVIGLFLSPALAPRRWVDVARP